MIKTSTQLKALVSNLSKQSNVDPLVLLRRYMMERFLERLSLSPYSSNFILKGGLLISSIAGIEIRSTLDIDTTVQGLSLSLDSISLIVDEISSFPMDDHISFSITKVSPIMDDAEYQGYRVSLFASLEKTKIPIQIDISTGDAITPHAIQHNFKLMMEDRDIPLLSYPVETVLAEKIETILARSTSNTRMRDFYDIYLLTTPPYDSFQTKTILDALTATVANRHSADIMYDAEMILSLLETDISMEESWIKYQEKNPYSSSVSWTDVLNSTRNLCYHVGLPVDPPAHTIIEDYEFEDEFER